MPTTRPRHAITETDAVAAAIDDAARRWPEDSGNRARLLLRLVETGHHAITDAEHDRARQRIDVIDRTHGSLAGIFEAGYLDTLRQDFPA